MRPGDAAAAVHSHSALTLRSRSPEHTAQRLALADVLVHDSLRWACARLVPRLFYVIPNESDRSSQNNTEQLSSGVSNRTNRIWNAGTTGNGSVFTFPRVFLLTYPVENCEMNSATTKMLLKIFNPLNLLMYIGFKCFSQNL